MSFQDDSIDLKAILEENKNNLRRLELELKYPGIIPFVGAGLSKQFGFPLWKDFLIDQAPDILKEKVQERISAGEYEEAAEDLVITLTKRAFNLAIENYFGDHKLNGKKLDGAISLLPKLALGPVITTNFDHTLEKVFENADRPLKAVWGAKADMINRALRRNESYLIKLHGDVDDEADRILTFTDYMNKYGESYSNNDQNFVLRNVLMQILISRTILFIGCSLNNDRTVKIMGKVAEIYPSIDYYAIVEKPESKESIFKREHFFSEHGILPIWYPPGKHDSITQILSYLIKKTPPKLQQKSTGIDTNPRKNYFNNIGMEFVLIPAGEFNMGSSEYLFNWNDIPGNDNERLIEFLMNIFGFSNYWAETVNIDKIDDGKTIRLNFNNNFLYLKLNNERTEVSLEIDDWYLFSLYETPGNDSERLINFLRQKFDIDWIKAATIENIDNGKTIRVSTGINFLLLTLNNEKILLKVEIDDGRTDEFNTKIENNKIYIYEDKKTEKIIARTENSKLNIYSEEYSWENPVHKVTINDPFYLGVFPVTQRQWKKLMDKEYLFNWNDIPGNDSQKLINFLRQRFDVDWIKAANIKKIDDDNTIRITNEIKKLSLTLYNEKTNVNLEIDDGRYDKFIVIRENDELKIYMENNPSNFKGDNLPVERVSWNDVQEFITKLNKLENETKYCLPSEAEWEYANRAGSASSYFFGDEDYELKKYAWYNENSNIQTKPVGGLYPNQWGLYDMAGNVWEWVQDTWHKTYESAYPDNRPREDGDVSHRTVRGGCWNTKTEDCRSAARTEYHAGTREHTIGFRLMKVL